jgi:protein-S-isoprenylcysteine O-methyltransferase Ste14
MNMTTSNRYVLIQFVLFAIFAGATIVLPSSPASPIKLVGLLAVGVAIGIFVAAIVAFRRATQTLPNVTPDPKKNTKLVQAGIYGYIRHPIYTAVLVGTLGIALYHGALPLLGIWAGLLVFFWFKAEYEETLLKAQFADYAMYKRKTGKFWF